MRQKQRQRRQSTARTTRATTVAKVEATTKGKERTRRTQTRSRIFGKTHGKICGLTGTKRKLEKSKILTELTAWDPASARDSDERQWIKVAVSTDVKTTPQKTRFSQCELYKEFAYRSTLSKVTATRIKIDDTKHKTTPNNV